MRRHFLHLAGLSVLAAGLGLPAPARPDAEPEPTTVKDSERAKFIPQRRYAPLKGKAVGLMVSHVRDVMAHDGRGGPADAVAFSTADGSYRWVYVPVDDKAMITNLQVEVGEKGGKKKAYPKLSIANAGLLKGRGVAADYSLVETEVNDGLGSPAGESFVGTKFTRLDGSEKYPLKLPDVVKELKKRYQADLKARQKKVDAEMEGAKKKALKGRKVTGPKETAELMYLTWLPDSQRVRVAFHTRLSDGSYQWVQGGARLPPGKGALAFRPPPPPPDRKVRVGVTFGVEVGMAYEVDKSGKVVATKLLPPKGFSQELQAPPAGGGPRGR